MVKIPQDFTLPESCANLVHQVRPFLGPLSLLPLARYCWHCTALAHCESSTQAASTGGLPSKSSC